MCVCWGVGGGVVVRTSPASASSRILQDIAREVRRSQWGGGGGGGGEPLQHPPSFRAYRTSLEEEPVGGRGVGWGGGAAAASSRIHLTSRGVPSHRPLPSVESKRTVFSASILSTTRSTHFQLRYGCLQKAACSF